MVGRALSQTYGGRLELFDAGGHLYCTVSAAEKCVNRRAGFPHPEKYATILAPDYFAETGPVLWRTTISAPRRLLPGRAPFISLSMLSIAAAPSRSFG